MAWAKKGLSGHADRRFPGEVVMVSALAKHPDRRDRARNRQVWACRARRAGAWRAARGIAAGILALVAGLGAGHPAAAADQDHPILLEVVHLRDPMAYQASCEVTDGLGTTRASSFVGETNSSVRFIGTRVACRLRATDAGPFQVTLRTAGTVLARARGTAEQPVIIAAR